MMSMYKRTQASRKASGYPHLTFIQRTDLVDYLNTDKLIGRFHISNGKGWGLCYMSSPEYTGLKKNCEPKWRVVPHNEEGSICWTCLQTYNKMKREGKEMVVFKTEDIINLNGEIYVKASVAQFAIQEAVKAEQEKAVRAEGEVRTIQSVAIVDALKPNSFRTGETIKRTQLAIKTTSVVYKPGMKIRISIVKDAP